MSNRRDFIKKGTIAMAGVSLAGTSNLWGAPVREGFVSKRPAAGKRNFSSAAVEDTIKAARAKVRIPSWPGCLRIVSPIRWTQRWNLAAKMANPTLL